MDAQFFKRLEQMRAGIPNDPTIRQYTDKGFVCMDHEKALQSEAALPMESLPNNFQQSLCMSEIRRIINSVVQLNVQLENRVNIMTLCKNTDVVLKGKYFLCRTLAPPFKMVAMMTVVEDPEGERAVRLSLYNYPFADWSSLEAMCEELPVGQMLIIKNPWFKSTLDGGFSLRCDNPGDLVFLSTVSFEEKFPTISWKGEIPIHWRKYVKKTAEEWKNEGNELFRKAEYEQAVEYYTTGLQLKPGEEVTKALLSNRAAAYIAMRCFRKALKDLDKLLSIDPRHEKGNYRKAKCLIGLQLYTDAVTFIEALPVKARTFDALLESASTQYKQQTTGSYDIMKLYTSEGTTCHEDVAEYVGPVRKEHIPGKGRGLVATRDISAGEVLLVSKAFDVVFPPKKYLQTLAISINFETNYINPPGHDLLVKTIAQRVKLEPELTKELYELYAGPHLSSWSTEDGNENQMPPVDLKRIDAICSYNAFGDCSMGTRRNKRDEAGDGTDSFVDKNDITGLWVMPSYINHSCWNCNCRWSTFGNVMLVRACKSIVKGEEILLPYVASQDELDKRQEIMEKHAFVCTCQLCLLDSDTSAAGIKRRELLKKIEELIPKNEDGSESEKWKMTGAKQVLKLIKELNQLKLPQINPGLIQTLFSLAMYFTQKGNNKQSMNLMLQCHSMTENSPLVEKTVQSTVNVIGNLLLQNKIQAAQKWIETLKRELMVCYGTTEVAADIFPYTTALMAKAGISL